MATGKLKILLADRFFWCEQSAEGVECEEADAAIHVAVKGERKNNISYVPALDIYNHYTSSVD